MIESIHKEIPNVFLWGKHAEISIDAIKDDISYQRSQKKFIYTFLNMDCPDFIGIQYWNSIRIANRKHDLIGIKIYDPYEINLPDIGMIKVEDPETGSMFWIDTSFEPDLKQMNNNNIKSLVDLEKQSAKIGLDIISISTTEDYVDPLMKFFKRRGKKY